MDHGLHFRKDTILELHLRKSGEFHFRFFSVSLNQNILHLEFKHWRSSRKKSVNLSFFLFSPQFHFFSVNLKRIIFLYFQQVELQGLPRKWAPPMASAAVWTPQIVSVAGRTSCPPCPVDVVLFSSLTHTWFLVCVASFLLADEMWVLFMRLSTWQWILDRASQLCRLPKHPLFSALPVNLLLGGRPGQAGCAGTSSSSSYPADHLSPRRIRSQLQ